MDYLKKINKLFYFSSFIIFGLSILSHFAYKWSGFNNFLGAFVPTNESIFQHVKMYFYPTVLYYFITFLLFSSKYEIDAKRYFIPPLITMILTTFIVVGNYYVFRNGFNIDSMIIDISLLFIGLLLSSFLCKHVYNMKKVMRFSGYASLLLIFALAVTMTYFQINPRHVDFFYDNENKTYHEVYK